MQFEQLQKDMIAAMKARDKVRKEYQARYDIFQEYAPKMMSAQEVESFLTDKYADLVAQKNKGLIMKTVMPELKGKAEGSMINQVVARLCR